MGFDFLHIFETFNPESSRYENLCQIFVHKILWVFLNTASLSCASFSFLSFFLVLKLKQIAYGWKSRTSSILFLSNLRNWIKIEIVNEIKKLSVYLTTFMFEIKIIFEIKPLLIKIYVKRKQMTLVCFQDIWLGILVWNPANFAKFLDFLITWSIFISALFFTPQKMKTNLLCCYKSPIY